MTRCGWSRTSSQYGNSSASESTIIEKSSGFDEQSACVGAGTTGHPTDRSRTGQSGHDVYGASNMVTLNILGYAAIIDPTIAMADDFMAAVDNGFGKLEDVVPTRARRPSTLTFIEKSRKTSSRRHTPRRLPYSKTDFHAAALERRHALRDADVVEHAFRLSSPLERLASPPPSTFRLKFTAMTRHPAIADRADVRHSPRNRAHP